MVLDLIWFGVGAGLLLGLPLWRIFGRAGFRPYLSLLVFVPILGVLIVLFWLALVPWPAVATEKSARQ